MLEVTDDPELKKAAVDVDWMLNECSSTTNKVTLSMLLANQVLTDEAPSRSIVYKVIHVILFTFPSQLNSNSKSFNFRAAICILKVLFSEISLFISICIAVTDSHVRSV